MLLEFVDFCCFYHKNQKVATSITPHEDVVINVDKHTGTQYHIPCLSQSPQRCHSMAETFCHVFSNCFYKTKKLEILTPKIQELIHCLCPDYFYTHIHRKHFGAWKECHAVFEESNNLNSNGNKTEAIKFNENNSVENEFLNSKNNSIKENKRRFYD